MKVLEYKGYKFINLSSHPLIFEDGIVLEPYDLELANEVFAVPKEKSMGDLFVQTVFEQNKESLEILKQLKKKGYTVISSIINAQAYPSLCVSPIVTPETARAPPSEKRVQYKFNIY